MANNTPTQKAKLSAFKFVMQHMTNDLTLNDVYAHHATSSQEIIDTTPTDQFIPACLEQIQTAKEFGIAKLWDDVTGKTKMDTTFTAWQEACDTLHDSRREDIGSKAIKLIGKEMDQKKYAFFRAEDEYKHRMQKPRYKDIDRVIQSQRITQLKAS